MKVAVLASPLSARSGVYRSTIDLVAAARGRGLDWSAAVGVRPDAAGEPTRVRGVREWTALAHGRSSPDEAIRLLDRAGLRGADVVISMVPQSDVALARGPRPARSSHVAWVRGLPWPARGEQNPLRRAAVRVVEQRALRRADDVWTTSPLLAQQIRSTTRSAIVPAGVPLLERQVDGSQPGTLIWAGRFSSEKHPELFVHLARTLAVPARMHGEGPMRRALELQASGAVDFAGWAAPDNLWTGHGIAVCTSRRDAFGRSPVEAASAGLPVVLSNQTGVAPLLYTDAELRHRFVLPVDEPKRWLRAVRELHEDGELRRLVSDHVHRNASRLSIGNSLDAALRRLDRTLDTTTTDPKDCP